LRQPDVQKSTRPRRQLNANSLTAFQASAHRPEDATSAQRLQIVEKLTASDARFPRYALDFV